MGNVGEEPFWVVVGELEMHAPLQKFGGCDVFRDGRDAVVVLEDGVIVATVVRGTMSGLEGEGGCARVWSGSGVVGGVLSGGEGLSSGSE